MLRGHRYIFLLVASRRSYPSRNVDALLLTLETRRWKDERGDPSAFSVNLFGIPEILEALPRTISLARLHNIVFILSCNLVHAFPSCIVLLSLPLASKFRTLYT